MMVRKQLLTLGTLIVFTALFAQACAAEEEPAAAQTQTAAPAAGGPLMDPASPAMNETAPAMYKVLFSTSKGDFTIEVHRDWAPRGADRFYNLVKNGFFDETRFFRVIREPQPFMVQFGISGNPALNPVWEEASIMDDPVMQPNARGTISFATRGPNTRTTQVFISYGDNSFLDNQGFSPFGTVIQGMEIVDQFNAEYGESPNQGLINAQGNAYLTKDFPNLDFTRTARIVP